MDRQQSIMFAKSIVEGIKTSTTNQARWEYWEYIIADLISPYAFDPAKCSKILGKPYQIYLHFHNVMLSPIF